MSVTHPGLLIVASLFQASAAESSSRFDAVAKVAGLVGRQTLALQVSELGRLRGSSHRKPTMNASRAHSGIDGWHT